MKPAEKERARLRKGGALHWVHWLVIATSLLLTLGAYAFSKSLLDQESAAAFDRGTRQVHERERKELLAVNELGASVSPRRTVDSKLPTVILFGGLVIHGLLVWFFVSIARANRRALAFADLAVAELEEQNHRLEMSNKDLELFANIAAHDLQEPIRVVGSYAQLMQEDLQEKGIQDATLERYSKHLIDGALRMQKLVESLLNYSRVDNAQRSFETVEADVALKEAMSNLSVALKETNAVVVAEELPPVSMDKAQLTQVFQNLLANSIKFQRDHRPEVRVSVQPSEGSNWRFSVQDNGIGIAPEFQDGVFGIFRRLHSREEYEGTGIGLAVTKKIIERNGGRIWVESTLGEGATFHFCLPEVGSKPGLTPSV